MNMKLPPFPVAQRAVCGTHNPMDFLHLGIMYAEGIGIASNAILAHYFIQKAIDMGCREAEEYLHLQYESGKRDFATEMESIIGDTSSFSKETAAKVWGRAEVERKAKNYGNLSKISEYLPWVYPEYNRVKAINDILNDRDTIDADILLATCTTDNTSEIYIEQQEKLLSQLFAPFRTINIDWDDLDADILERDESELAQCLVNYTDTYDIICRRYHVDRKEIFTLKTLKFYPYVKTKDLALLRRQGLRCLLSVKDTDPAIREKYLNNLRDDKTLLDICEHIKDQDLQLFLISFVELNIDLDALEINALRLLRAYRNGDLAPLAERLNTFAERLTKHGISHDLPTFSPEMLPPLNL